MLSCHPSSSTSLNHSLMQRQSYPKICKHTELIPEKKQKKNLTGFQLAKSTAFSYNIIPTWAIIHKDGIDMSPMCFLISVH